MHMQSNLAIPANCRHLRLRSADLMPPNWSALAKAEVVIPIAPFTWWGTHSGFQTDTQFASIHSRMHQSFRLVSRVYKALAPGWWYEQYLTTTSSRKEPRHEILFQCSDRDPGLRGPQCPSNVLNPMKERDPPRVQWDIYSIVRLQAKPSSVQGQLKGALDKYLVNANAAFDMSVSADVTSQCFALYLPMLNEVAATFSSSYQACIATANDELANLTAQALKDQAVYQQDVSTLCGAFTTCDQNSGNDSSVFFQCYASAVCVNVHLIRMDL